MADDVADEGSGGPGPGPDAAIGGIDENLDPDGVVVEEETSQNGNEVLVENRLEVLGYWICYGRRFQEYSKYQL